MSELEARFNNWWDDEGLDAVKEVLVTAWMNGAYVERRNQEEETV